MFGGDAVALSPRPDRVDRYASRICYQPCGSRSFDDVRVCKHIAIMHNALQHCKRLLRYESDYAFCMNTANHRLRRARELAGYRTAVDAANSMGIPTSTYIGHENGHRGFPASRAPQYAKKFKVAEEWLLYGKGDGHAIVLDGAEPTMPIPLLGDVPAGPWREAITKSRNFIPAPQAGLTSDAYALRVTGDSMDRIAPDGSIIIIDPTDYDLFERRLFVVRNGDGEVTFKQYRDSPARLVPCSTNAAHKVIPVTAKEYEIIGRVVKIVMDPDQAALD